MASPNTGDEVARELKERQEKALIPAAPALEASVAASISARRLLRINASPTALDGTRSPSAVPDRSPASQAPTSLRSVASTSNSSALRHTETVAVPEVQSGPTKADISAIAAQPVSPSGVPATAEHDDEELSEADDEDGVSVLNDDLQLERDEY